MNEKIKLMTNAVVIEKIAEIMHKLIFQTNTDYEKLPKYLNDYGVDVYYADLDNVDGFLQIEKGPSKPAIIVKRLQYEPRQRFTMAHELGHLMLHLKWNPYKSFVSAGVMEITMYRGNADTPIADNQKETDANKFAAAFLMPKHKIVPLLKEVSSTINKDRIVANTFCVSITAARFRINDLDVEGDMEL